MTPDIWAYAQWGLVVVVICCAWYSYREGHKQGILDGIEGALYELERDKIIKIDDSGNIERYPTDYLKQFKNKKRK